MKFLLMLLTLVLLSALPACNAPPGPVTAQVRVEGCAPAALPLAVSAVQLEAIELQALPTPSALTAPATTWLAVPFYGREQLALSSDPAAVPDVRPRADLSALGALTRKLPMPSRQFNAVRWSAVRHC